MRALLDTNAFLWFCADHPSLGRNARHIIMQAETTVFLSIASVWEISIKYARRRMPELIEPPEIYIPSRIQEYDFDPLDIRVEHAFMAGRLPDIHRDPFDRMLIAQAQVEGLPIVTSDANIARYDVEIIW